MSGRISRAVCAVVVAMASLMLCSLAIATDRVTLRSGEVLEGRIEQELNGYLWFTARIGGIEQSRTLAPEDIKTVERNIEGAADPVPVVTPTPGPGPTGGGEVVDDPNLTKGVVLSLGGPEGDMVGLYMAAKPLNEVMDELVADGVDVVVFYVDSGGGMLIEINRLVDAIREYRQHFRVVAWINKAISAAAMTSHVIEDIYFKTNGTYGACTGFNGGTGAPVEGRALEEILFYMERVSDWGQKDPAIMRSMQVQEPLSCDIDENGDVHWHQSLDGQYEVSDGVQILTFNSNNALRYGFSRGTADTLDELTSELGMGEIQWLGESRQGLIYPISEAEQHQIDFRLTVKRAEERLGEYMGKYQMARGQIGGDQQTRAAMGQRSLAALQEVKRLVENNPNFGLQMGFPTIERFREWYEQQVQEVRDLMR